METTDVNLTLVTDFVPSEIACLASSPGSMRRTDVCISRDEIVDFLEYAASSEMNGRMRSEQDERHALEASVAMRSKISLTNEFKMAIALLEIPVSACTCLSTLKMSDQNFLHKHDASYPCRCKKSKFPFGLFSASSFPRQ